VQHRRKRLFHIAVLVIGTAVLAISMNQLGVLALHEAIVGVGAWFAVIAAIDLASACCDAFAIQAFLSPRIHVRYRTAFVAQLSGMAINRLTPGNSLGEPVKVTTLAEIVPANLAVSAIVMFNITTLYVAIAAIVIGVPITLMLLDLPSQVELGVWILTAGLVAGAIAIAVVVRRGAVATLIDILEGPHLISRARGEKWRAAIADIDARLRELGGDTRTSGLRRGLAGVVASRVLGWVGTIVLLHAASIPMQPVLVVAMLSVGILVSWLSNIAPLGLGVSDGTNYILYRMLGAAPQAGVLYAMVNRLRTIVVALMGLAVMAIAHAYRRGRSRSS
jgi:hypothetical protein